MLIDYYKRPISYLRFSLTGKCNLKCRYCFSQSGCSDTPELSISEVKRILAIFSEIGIRKVRFTGGEPLLKKDIVDIIKFASNECNFNKIGITTNGLLLSDRLEALIDAGLNSLNISLDTLDNETFHRITGVDGLGNVLKSVENAEKSGIFDFVKINMVVMREVNLSDIPRFIDWARHRRLDLRFIEYMPTKNSTRHSSQFVGETEVREKIGEKLIPENDYPFAGGPAKSYVIKGHPLKISFISAVSSSFCSECNRIRLTSVGRLLGCLFREENFDLPGLLKKSTDNKLIANQISDILRAEHFRRKPGQVSIGDYMPDLKEIGG